MPLLLEDLAEDAAAGLGRTAERFDAAAKELARPDATGDEVARFARHITAYALAELPRAEAAGNGKSISRRRKGLKWSGGRSRCRACSRGNRGCA